MLSNFQDTFYTKRLLGKWLLAFIIEQRSIYFYHLEVLSIQFHYLSYSAIVSVSVSVSILAYDTDLGYKSKYKILLDLCKSLLDSKSNSCKVNEFQIFLGI